MRSKWLIFPGIVASMAIGLPARADDAANTATARALGIEGVTLAEAGRCRDAIEKLERAEQLHHAPTTATRLGECEIDVGKLVLGTERLQRVVREPLPANAHPAFVAAVARAQKSLEKALPRIPAIRISVKAPAGTRFALTIDGEAAPEAIVDTNRRIDPGQHKVVVTADGFLASAATAALEEGQTKNVSLELERDPRAMAQATTQETTDHELEYVAPERKNGSKAAAVVAFAAAGAGLGVGIFAGINVATKSSSLEGSCDANHVCPADRDADIRSAKTWATVSTIGFATAGVGTAAGIVLLLTSGSARQTGAHVRPTVGLGSVGLVGAF